jgi:ribonuclease HI
LEQVVEIFTDGACRGNPGIGGWGVLIRYGEAEKKLYGGEISTTNNRMELKAVIEGLSALTKPCKVKITTDSKYVMTGATEWLDNWKKRSWKTAGKKQVLNVDLWMQLDRLINKHELEWFWVKGHSGHAENEMADQLANQGIDELI